MAQATRSQPWTRRSVTSQEAEEHRAAHSQEGGFYTRQVDNSLLRQEATSMILRRVSSSIQGTTGQHSITIDLPPSAWELLIPRHELLPLGWSRHWTPGGRDVIVILNSFPNISWLFGRMWYKHQATPNSKVKQLDFFNGVRMSYSPEHCSLNITFKNALYNSNGYLYP
jgi:hypothetical protein